ncbi:protein of unknown function [Fodinibius roseus]|uniref:eCIS core domain-containing protein n=1 Tax=Fodinibius roseus TaxID=1194090 RepID=A0A1M4ZJW6_9BACT|nr:DUF4157 domain-containing protein [Fodinibius roseus]SHF18291.1 protein of unknown function [Fodinibius roseus]
MFQNETKNDSDNLSGLEIGNPDDQFEKEADAVADKVMMMPDPHPPSGDDEEDRELQMHPSSSQKMRMKSAHGEQPVLQMQAKNRMELTMRPSAEEEESGTAAPVQAKPENNSTDRSKPENRTGRLGNSTRGGQPLPKAVNSELSSKMGADFSSVRVHSDSNAIRMNQQLGARAFTHGSDIYFNKGEFDPSSTSGKHLLAHELTHVMQQREGTTPAIQRYDDEWSVPGSEVTVSLSGISFHPHAHELSVSRTYRQQGIAIILKKLLEDEYEEGLENRIPANGEYYGLWGDPDRTPDEEGRSIGSLTLDYEVALNVISWLEEHDYTITGITERERELLQLGRVSGDLYESLRDDLPPWVSEFIFQRLMAKHGSLLEEYRQQQGERESDPYSVTTCAGEGCLETRILRALRQSINVMEAIRHDFTLTLSEESQRFYELAWEVPEQGIPTRVEDETLASRFLLFCYTQPAYSERAVSSHEARVEIIRRFMSISMSQTEEGRSETVRDEPTTYNTPPFPAYIKSFPELKPLSGVRHTLPLAFAVTGAEYDFSMNLVYPDIYDALGAYFSYGYHWEFSRVPLQALLEGETPSEEETESGQPTLGGAIVSRLNRAIEYRQEDYETIEEDLGIFAPMAYNLVELNSTLRALGAVTLPFFYELNRPIHEKRFVFEEPGVYFVTCVTYRRSERTGEEAVVRVPSEAIYAFPIYVNSPDVLSGRYLFSSQVEAQNRRERVGEIQERLESEDLEEEERTSLERELRQLQILTGSDVGREIKLRRDAIVEAVLSHEKNRIQRLPSDEQQEALQDRLTAIESALDEEDAFGDDIIALAQTIMEERSEASRDDRDFYAPLERGLKQINQILSVRSSRGLTSAQRVRAHFIGDEGATIELTIEYVHDEENDEYHISDLTTPDSGDTTVDEEETDDQDTPPVVLGIVDLLESTAGYGERGYVAVEWDSTRYVREVNASTARIITEGIDNAVTIVELAAIAAAPFTGGSSLAILAPIGIIGATPAAYRLISRYEDSTLRLDWNSASDMLALLGAAGEAGSALRLVRIPNRTSRIVLGLGHKGLEGIIIGGSLWQEIEQIQSSNLSLGEKRTRLMLALGRALRDFGMLIGESMIEKAYDHDGAPDQTIPASEAGRLPGDEGSGDQPSAESETGSELDTPDPGGEQPVDTTEATPSEAETEGAEQPAVSEPSSPETGEGTPSTEGDRRAEATEGTVAHEEGTEAEAEQTEQTQYEATVEELARRPDSDDLDSLPPETRALVDRLTRMIGAFQRMKDRAEGHNVPMAESLAHYIDEAAGKREELMNNPDSEDARVNADDLLDGMQEIRNVLRGRLDAPEETTEGETDREADPAEETQQETEGEVPESRPDQGSLQTPADLMEGDQFSGFGDDSRRLNELYRIYKEGDESRAEVSPIEWAYRTRGEARKILDSYLPEGWARRRSRSPGRAARGEVVVTITQSMLDEIPYPSDEVSLPMPVRPGDSLILRASTDRPSTTALRRLFMDNLDNLSAEVRQSFDEAVQDTMRRFNMRELRDRGLIFYDIEGNRQIWPVDEAGNALEVHHIIELRWGGTNAPANLIAIKYREHELLSRWWNDLQSYVLQDSELGETFENPDAQGERAPEADEMMYTE